MSIKGRYEFGVEGHGFVCSTGRCGAVSPALGVGAYLRAAMLGLWPHIRLALRVYVAVAPYAAQIAPQGAFAPF